MNRGRSRQDGYTILETLIFLAVSGAMFLSAMALVSGQQAKTTFTTSVRDFELKLTGIAGTVGSGYYNNTNNFRCDDANNDGRVEIISGAGQQGANSKCIFLGKAVQFGPATTQGERYNVYSVAGARSQPVTGNDVENFVQARPTLIAQGTLPYNNAITNDAIESLAFGGGLAVKWVRYNAGGANPDIDIGGFGFFSKLEVSGQNASAKSGSLRVDVVVPVPSAPPPNLPTSVGQSAATFVDQMDKLDAGNTIINPAGGIVICLKSGGTNQHALINLGSNQSGNITTNVEFAGGDCP